MYCPPHFREDRVPVLHDAIRRIGFGTLITHGEEGLGADHVPILLDAGAGMLRGHVARANAVWRNLEPGAQALAVFLGPDAYVSPSWYPSKAETGKAVPTWNYLTVHARGPLTWSEDPDWLRAHVAAFSAAHEAGRERPWSIDDAPPDYIAAMLRAIVGFELSIASLEGKLKLSQNRSPADREAVREAFLHESADSQALARLMGDA